jgi:hypothetical protein
VECQQLQCPSGCYRRFVILLSVPPHSSRQLLCPSASFIQPLLIRSIPPCSQQCCCFSAWHPAAKHKPKPSRMHSHFHKPLHGSLGSIPLLPRYFISAGFSPPAANFYFARRSPHLGCVHLAAAIAHSSLISQSIAKVHLHSSATSVPCGKYTPVASYGAAIAFVPHALLSAPLWGLAVRLRSFVPHHSGGRQKARNWIVLKLLVFLNSAFLDQFVLYLLNTVYEKKIFCQLTLN